MIHIYIYIIYTQKQYIQYQTPHLFIQNKIMYIYISKKIHIHIIISIYIYYIYIHTMSLVKDLTSSRTMNDPCIAAPGLWRVERQGPELRGFRDSLVVKPWTHWSWLKPSEIPWEIMGKPWLMLVKL